MSYSASLLLQTRCDGAHSKFLFWHLVHVPRIRCPACRRRHCPSCQEGPGEDCCPGEWHEGWWSLSVYHANFMALMSVKSSYSYATFVCSTVHSASLNFVRCDNFCLRLIGWGGGGGRGAGGWRDARGGLLVWIVYYVVRCVIICAYTMPSMSPLPMPQSPIRARRTDGATCKYNMTNYVR